MLNYRRIGRSPNFHVTLRTECLHWRFENFDVPNLTMKLATAISSITVICVVSQTSDAGEVFDVNFHSGSNSGGLLQYGVDVVSCLTYTSPCYGW
jgi:hypothetical protein